MANLETGQLYAPLASTPSADVAMSADGTKLYSADPDGKVRVYDIASRTLLETWDVGIELGGIDLSPDGSFLMVVDRQFLSYTPGPNWTLNAGTIAAYKVEIATGAVTVLPVDVTGNQGPFFDIVVLNDGTALLTESLNGATGSYPALWTLDIDAGQYTHVQDPYLTDDPMLWRTADGSHALIAPPNESSARLKLYEAGTGIVASSTGGPSPAIETRALGMQAISEAAGLIVQSQNRAILVRNFALQVQFDLAALHPGLRAYVITGMAFDGAGANLYILDQAADTITQISTADWSIVRTFSVGTEASNAADPYPDGDYGNQLLVTPDGRYFTVVTGTGLQLIENDGLSNNFAGTPGVDVLDGGAADDQLSGLGGNDDLRGGSGNDMLDGGDGDDTLNGGGGVDQMAGGIGNDIYEVDSSSDVVTEHPGEGTDEVRTGLGTYVLAANVEYLTATTDAAHDFRGNAGDNVITGAGGNDTFRMQDGGTDSASGGGGNDFFLFGTGLDSSDAADGGAGNDQIAIQGNYNLTFGGGLVNIESLIPLPGNDVRFGDSGTNFYDYVLATVDANVAAGQRLTVDANRLRVGEDFTFNGSAETDGNFFLIGGNGVDTLTGGAQSDTFLFGENGQFGASDVVNGGPGGTNDQLGLRGNYTITFGAGQLIGLESIALVSSQDTRFGPLGSVFSYNLTMNDGNVAAGQLFTVDGAPLRANETLTFNGAAELNGSYRVAGGAGNDSMIGGAQGDILIGRGGADTMKGGGGADVFRFNAVSDSTGIGFDTLVEFNFQADRIDLPVAVTGWTASLRGALNGATFDADIAAAIDAGLNPHSAVMFSPDSGDFSGRSFAIVDADGDGSYQAGQDYVFEVTPNAFPFDPVTPNVFI